MSDDTRRIEDLQRMQRIATGLLVVVALVFVVASAFRHLHPAVGFVRAFAEAAMIGAIADWFAVTALFRYPLGLRIPHTAIIPNRKKQIANAFGNFVTNNFMDPERIVTRIRANDVAGKLAHWLGNPKRSRQIADVIAEILAGSLQVINDVDIEPLIDKSLVNRFRAVPITPVVGRTLGLVADDERRRRFFLGAAEAATHWVTANQPVIRTYIIKELPRWMARFNLDQFIYEKIVELSTRTLGELRADPNHSLYQQFNLAIERLIVDLQTSEAMRAQGEALKDEFLNHPVVRESARSIWQEIKESLIQQARTPDSALHQSIQQGIERIAAAFEADPVWRSKIEGWVEAIARYLIHRYGPAIGNYLTQTIRDWDTDSTTRRIELQFGRDLQYIRINGTIVGGLVGLVIYTITLLTGGM